MLLSLQSTVSNTPPHINAAPNVWTVGDARSYSHLQTNINIPWNCEYIKYHVASINTRNILILTSDDYIEIEWGPDDQKQRRRITFENKFEVTIEYVYEKLTENLDEIWRVRIGDVDDDVDRRLNIELNQGVENLKFKHITHRAGLITGLYNVDPNETYSYTGHYRCFVFDIPILDYANKLYLVSKQGQSIQSNIGDKDYTPSVIASIDHIIREESLL